MTLVGTLSPSVLFTARSVPLMLQLRFYCIAEIFFIFYFLPRKYLVKKFLIQLFFFNQTNFGYGHFIISFCIGRIILIQP